MDIGPIDLWHLGIAIFFACDGFFRVCHNSSPETTPNKMGDLPTSPRDNDNTYQSLGVG